MVSAIIPMTVPVVPVLNSEGGQGICDQAFSGIQKMFFNSMGFLNAEKPWVGEPLLRRVEDLAKNIEGFFWGGLFAGGALGLAFDCSTLIQLHYKKITSDVELPDLHFKIQRLWLKCLSSLSSTIMTGTYFIGWMKSVQWMDLGSLAPVIKPIGYVASIISSCIKIVSFVGDYRFVEDEISRACNDRVRERFTEHRRFALLELIFSINSVAWGVLGMSSLLIASPVLSGLTFATLVLGGPLMVAIFCYKKYLADTHIEKTANCCTQLS